MSWKKKKPQFIIHLRRMINNNELWYCKKKKNRFFIIRFPSKQIIHTAYH